MCKYCKKLKEINDLDKESLVKIIKKWRQRDLQARKIISCLIDLYADDHNLAFWEDIRKGALYDSVYNEKEVIKTALAFLSCDWIGK